MKGILEFDLDDPQDREAFARAGNSLNAYLCLWDLSQYLRNKSKHESDPQKLKVYEDVYEDFYEYLEKFKIDFDDLS